LHLLLYFRRMVQNQIDIIQSLYKNWQGKQADSIEKIPQSGSDRVYFKVADGDKNFIATYNLNIKENQTFIYFSNHFKSLNIAVPKVIYVNEEQTANLQEDVGYESLLERLE